MSEDRFFVGIPVPDTTGDDDNKENENAEKNDSFFGDGCGFLQFSYYSLPGSATIKIS
jgi:hypothetical protein